jgi:hypothetical protein
MPAFLVTGNPGSGKSALADELARRGWPAIDPDHDRELSHWEDAAGRPAGGPPSPMNSGSSLIAGCGADPGWRKPWPAMTEQPSSAASPGTWTSFSISSTGYSCSRSMSGRRKTGSSRTTGSSARPQRSGPPGDPGGPRRVPGADAQARRDRPRRHHTDSLARRPAPRSRRSHLKPHSAASRARIVVPPHGTCDAIAPEHLTDALQLWGRPTRRV